MTIEIKGDCYVVGDIHGDAQVLVDVLSSNEITNCALILLGDIGIWRYRDYKHYRVLDEYGSKNNVTIYAFRGNHDNPAFFRHPNGRSPIVDRFWGKFTHFKLIPDLSIIDINGAKGIVIGGGLSIDRSIRRSFQYAFRNNGGVYKRNDWWNDEGLPITDGIEKKVDFILSHVGPRPTKTAPLNENNCQFFKIDYDLEDAINRENAHLDKIHKQFNPKKWWFGHFHINDAFDYGQTRCYAVDILNLSPVRI